MNSILVTGAAGFIGSTLVDELLQRGYRVVGVDNLFRGRIENLRVANENDRFTFEKMDLVEPHAAQQLNALIVKNKIEAAFHLAAINGTEYFYDAPWMVLDVNVRATQTVLHAIEQTDIRYLAYTSSSEVYGDPMMVPTPESHPVLLNAAADRDSYASSKAIGDFYVRLGAQKLGISALAMRVFNQYGPRMVGSKYGQVIGEFVRRALHESEFTIIGDGAHTRSFCLVSDGARAMADLLERSVTGTINVGNDNETTILELARLVHYKLGKDFSPTFLPERPHDHRRRCPDLSRLRAELPGFEFTDLNRGLDLTIDFFRKAS